MRVSLAAVSDVHAGSTVALCPPEGVPLDNGGTYVPSKFQRWLWQCWVEYWAWVRERLDIFEPEEKWLLLNGDLVEGDHHNTGQVIGRHGLYDGSVARRCLEVPLELGFDRIFVVRGTPSHVGQQGKVEEGIAKSLKEDSYPVEGDPVACTESWWHLRADAGRFRVDALHHGRTGYRRWTRPNATALLAADILMEHVDCAPEHEPERPPDLCIRSHVHKWADSGDQHRVRVVQTPAWQLHTEYGHKKVPESLADIGGALVEMDETIEVRRKLYRPDRGHVWTRAS